MASHGLTLAIYLATVLLLALGLRWITGRSTALLVALLALVPLVHFRGVAPVAATAVLLLASAGLGSFVARIEQHGPLVATIAGLGLIAGSAGWLLPFPVFSSGALAFALLLVVVLRWRAISANLRAGISEFSRAEASSPWAALGVSLVLAAASTPAWLPTLMADDLASHLQLPTQLTQFGVYRFDVGSQVWSLAPWLTDICHALVQVLGGREGVSVLNVAWLTMTALMVQRIGSLAGLGGVLSWLGAALYASLPLTAALTMSMQTETGSAAALAALALVVMRSQERPDRRTLLLAAILSGILLGMKVINVVFVVPPILWLLGKWKFRLPWGCLPISLGLSGYIAGSSYVFSGVLAGNPVLPLFNHVFQSPWFPVNRWIDDRWLSGFTLTLPYALTFRSDVFFEGAPGAAGFVLLGLVGGVAIGLASRSLRPLMLVAIAVWVLPLTQLQYLRYVQPAMVLVIPALLAGLAAPSRQRLLVGVGVMVVVMQIAFMPTATWILGNSALQLLWRAGEPGVLARFAPERLVARYQREHLRDSDRILIVSSEASLAEFGRKAFVTNWYDTALRHLVESAESHPRGWMAAAEYSGATHILVREHDAAVQEYLAAAEATSVAAFGEARLYRLRRIGSPGVTLRQGADSVTLSFDVTRTYATLIDARVDIECDRPLAPISFSWILRNAADQSGKELAHFQWLTCGIDRRASAVVAIAAPLPAGPLVFDASPVDPGRPAPFRVIAAWSDVRRDLATERDLSGRVRTLCPFSFCRIDSARILDATP